MKGRIKSAFDYKRPAFWVAAVAIVAAAAVCVGLTVSANRNTTSSKNTANTTASFDYEQVSFTAGTASYPSAYKSITATLINNKIENGLMCGEGFSLFKQAGEDWQTVPFADGTGFATVAIDLAVGERETYTLTPDMLTGTLKAGKYRIVTYVSYADETSPKTFYPVYAEFSIESK